MYEMRPTEQAYPSASRRGRARQSSHRRPARRVAWTAGLLGLVAVLTVAALLLTVPGLLPGTGSKAVASNEIGPAAPTQSPTPSASPTPTLPQRIPGLGLKMLAKIPAGSRQVLVTTGKGINSTQSTVVLYTKTVNGWRAGPPWSARNGRKGWTAHHRENDSRSPIGVFTLSDAGGLLPDVGTKMPYSQSSLFKISGTGRSGQPLAGSFDYVIAIDFNRKTGVSPLDHTRPLGRAKGGSIWIHVRSNGPTLACVGLAKADLRTLLKVLDPKKKPVIVMGDRVSLRK
jgi:L,D-peptidoglycan transpeptidase YkuD (ErfK/YbiS/YcfS/YnhG family)